MTKRAPFKQSTSLNGAPGKKTSGVPSWRGEGEWVRASFFDFAPGHQNKLLTGSPSLGPPGYAPASSPHQRGIAAEYINKLSSPSRSSHEKILQSCCIVLSTASTQRNAGLSLPTWVFLSLIVLSFSHYYIVASMHGIPTTTNLCIWKVVFWGWNLEPMS